MNRINWFGNDSIKKIKVRYSLSIKELIDWVSDPDHWIDIAVEVDDTSGSRPMAVAMVNQTLPFNLDLRCKKSLLLDAGMNAVRKVTFACGWCWLC